MYFKPFLFFVIKLFNAVALVTDSLVRLGTYNVLDKFHHWKYFAQHVALKFSFLYMNNVNFFKIGFDNFFIERHFI